MLLRNCRYRTMLGPYASAIRISPSPLTHDGCKHSADSSVPSRHRAVSNPLNPMKTRALYARGHLRTLALVCAFIVVDQSIAQQGTNESNPKDRFLREATSAWANYCEQDKRIQGEISFQLTGSDKSVNAKNHYVIKANKRCKLVSISRERSTDGK